MVLSRLAGEHLQGKDDNINADQPLAGHSPLDERAQKARALAATHKAAPPVAQQAAPGAASLCFTCGGELSTKIWLGQKQDETRQGLRRAGQTARFLPLPANATKIAC